MQDYEQLAQRIRAEVREAAARTPEWVKKHVEKVWHECYGQKDKAKTDEVEQRLREIEERASRATPGPWEAYGVGGIHMDGTSDGYSLMTTAGKRLHSPYMAEADADFAAHAREDVPWLLALLREREEENRRLRQIIADVRRLVETVEPDNPEVRA